MSKKPHIPEERIAELEAALEAALESGYGADHWDAVEIIQNQFYEQLYEKDSRIQTLQYNEDFLKAMVEASMSKDDKRIIRNMVATTKFFDVPMEAVMRWAKLHNPEVKNVTTRYYVIDVVKMKLIKLDGGEPYLGYGDFLKEGDEFLKNLDGKNLKDGLNE